jgi:chromosomal replication initiation ATPase DnaA
MGSHGRLATDGLDSESMPLSPRPQANTRQLRLDLERRRSFARADFIVSSSNATAVAALDAWPDWPGGKLALIGPRGSGKTHLARAWAERAKAIDGASFDGSAARPAGPVLLEDADLGVPEETLFHLLNAADGGRTLLITARTAPGAWLTRLPDLRSRLNALTTVTIDPADDELLLAIVEKLFSERNIRPKPELARYAIRRMERSVGAAQDFVLALDELAADEKREINVALARRLLQIGGETLESEERDLADDPRPGPQPRC